MWQKAVCTHRQNISHAKISEKTNMRIQLVATAYQMKEDNFNATIKL